MIHNLQITISIWRLYPLSPYWETVENWTESVTWIFACFLPPTNWTLNSWWKLFKKGKWKGMLESCLVYCYSGIQSLIEVVLLYTFYTETFCMPQKRFWMKRQTLLVLILAATTSTEQNTSKACHGNLGLKKGSLSSMPLMLGFFGDFAVGIVGLP